MDWACCVKDMLQLRDKWFVTGGSSSEEGIPDANRKMEHSDSDSDVSDCSQFWYDTFDENDVGLHVWDPDGHGTRSEMGSVADDDGEELQEVVAVGSSWTP